MSRACSSAGLRATFPSSVELLELGPRDPEYFVRAPIRPAWQSATRRAKLDRMLGLLVHRCRLLLLPALALLACADADADADADPDARSCDEKPAGAAFFADIGPCADPACTAAAAGIWGDPHVDELDEQTYEFAFSLVCTTAHPFLPQDEAPGWVLDSCTSADPTAPPRIAVALETYLGRRLALATGDIVHVDYDYVTRPIYHGRDVDTVWSLHRDDGSLVAAVGSGSAPNDDHTAPLRLEIRDQDCPPTPTNCSGVTTHSEAVVRSDDDTVVVRDGASATVGTDPAYDIIVAQAQRTTNLQCGYYSSTDALSIAIVAAPEPPRTPPSSRRSMSAQPKAHDTAQSPRRTFAREDLWRVLKKLGRTDTGRGHADEIGTHR